MLLCDDAPADSVARRIRAKCFKYRVSGVQDFGSGRHLNYVAITAIFLRTEVPQPSEQSYHSLLQFFCASSISGPGFRVPCEITVKKAAGNADCIDSYLLIVFL